MNLLAAIGIDARHVFEDPENLAAAGVGNCVVSKVPCALPGRSALVLEASFHHRDLTKLFSASDLHFRHDVIKSVFVDNAEMPALALVSTMMTVKRYRPFYLIWTLNDGCNRDSVDVIVAILEAIGYVSEVSFDHLFPAVLGRTPSYLTALCLHSVCIAAPCNSVLSSMFLEWYLPWERVVCIGFADRRNQCHLCCSCLADPRKTCTVRRWLAASVCTWLRAHVCVHPCVPIHCLSVAILQTTSGHTCFARLNP